jgi:hypothetical protein
VFITAWLAVTALGCAGDEGKGEEENIFDQYEEKADSFRQPTEHGQLVFGLSQDVELTEDHLYHAWDFTLAEQASVSIETVLVTANLDTVMYLYRFNPETERFGRYIARNDDADSDTVASRISRDLEAGDYRILVKGFKTSFRGRFQVEATCEGAGCAASGDCDPATFRSMPEGSPEACGEAISSALMGTTRDTGSTSVTLEEACALPDAARYGVELYYDYWDGLVGWEDMFGYYGDEIYVEVDWFTLSNGSWYVTCDGGGDEAAMDFLINPQGEVVAYYQHNQSPDFSVFCDGGESYYDEECGYLYLSAMPHAADAERTGTEEGVTDADASTRLDPVAFLAYGEYKRELSLQSDDPVTVTFVTWENDEGWGGWEEAGRVTVRADGQAAHHYELADDNTTQWLFAVERGDETGMVYDCREL